MPDLDALYSPLYLVLHVTETERCLWESSKEYLTLFRSTFGWGKYTEFVSRLRRALHEGEIDRVLTTEEERDLKQILVLHVNELKRLRRPRFLLVKGRPNYTQEEPDIVREGRKPERRRRWTF